MDTMTDPGILEAERNGGGFPEFCPQCDNQMRGGVCRDCERELEAEYE